MHYYYNNFANCLFISFHFINFDVIWHLRAENRDDKKIMLFSSIPFTLNITILKIKIFIRRTLQKALNMFVQAIFTEAMFLTVLTHSLHTHVFANFSDYRGSSNSTNSISRCFTIVLLTIHTQFQ